MKVNKKNKNRNQNIKKNNFPYLNEIKHLKDEFKKMIDEMSDEEFLSFTFDFMGFMNEYDEDLIEEMWADDEGWEDEAEKFYNNSNENEDLPF